jgi:molecular chaperone GrpE
MKKGDKNIKLDGQVEDLTNRWKRALADYENLEKRINAEKNEFVKFANAKLLLKILPALDTLEKANNHLKDEGLGLAMKQLADGLEAEGLMRIETRGKDFDPQLMECTDTVEGDEGKAIEEVRPGYMLNERVLRVAQVRVGKQKIDEKQEELARGQLQKGDYT